VNTPPSPARVTAWDRVAILLLGAVGFALSYDALRQMAVAIHVRGHLTALFPLLVDGFIGYGVRALLVLRDAPLPARVYTWALFLSATTASIWANALHAVRRNQQGAPTGGEGLRLGDSTVGVLSILAPLALAGAVHLYILIARRTDPTDPPQTLPDERTPDHRAPGHLRTPTAPAPAPTAPTQGAGARPTTTETVSHLSRTPSDQVTGGNTDQDRDLRGQPLDTPGHAAAGHPAAGDRPTRDTDRPRPPAASTPVDPDRLALARRAVTEAGRTTRSVVADAIRGQGLTLSNSDLTDLMRHLKTPPGQDTATDRD